MYEERFLRRAIALSAAVQEAAAMGVPQCIAVVGAGGHLPAFATRGQRVNLPGGLPVIAGGHVIGGIGVGSGTGAQDRQVAQAGLTALGSEG